MDIIIISPVNCLRDSRKMNSWLEEFKTQPIQIPYFLQLNCDPILFSLFWEMNYNKEPLVEWPKTVTYQEVIYAEYNIGFWDKKVIFPAQFCQLGIKCFESNWLDADHIKNSIVDTGIMFSILMQIFRFKKDPYLIMYPSFYKKYKKRLLKVMRDYSPSIFSEEDQVYLKKII